MQEDQFKNVIGTLDAAVALIDALPKTPSDKDLDKAQEQVTAAEKAVQEAEKLLAETRKAVRSALTALRAADDAMSRIHRELDLRRVESMQTPFWSEVRGSLRTCEDQVDDIPDAFAESRGSLGNIVNRAVQLFYLASECNTSADRFSRRDMHLSALAVELSSVRGAYLEITRELRRTLP